MALVQKSSSSGSGGGRIRSGGEEEIERPKWITIQMNTFTNWLNQQLLSGRLRITNLDDDLADGVLLIQVVETLQKRICTGKIYRNNPTEIQKLMNVQMALDALREDRVKLVNIGSQDIVEGNLKLILGLIWCLIQRYQIATHSKIPPKKLIMAYLQSVLPEIKLTNFRINWNDGIAISALIDYCQPGLIPDWRELNPNQGFANCSKALSIAERDLNIPAIISAEHLSSDELDELSSITYLSYFVKRNGPGYKATLENVRKLLPDVRINDFERSWNDGYLLARLVEAVGGSVPGFGKMVFDDPSYWPENIAQGLDGALELGIASVIGPEDIADLDVEHLGVLALAAALCSVTHQPTPTSFLPQQKSVGGGSQQKPIEPIFKSPSDSPPITTTCFQNQQLNLDLAFAEGSNININDIDVIIFDSNNEIMDNQTLELRKHSTDKGAVISFIPKIAGKYQVHILCEQTELPTSPISLDVLTATSRIETTHSTQQQQPQAPPPPSHPPPSLTPISTAATASIFKETNTQQPKLGKKVSALVAALDQQNLTHQSPLTKSTSGPSSNTSDSQILSRNSQHLFKQKSEDQTNNSNSLIKKMEYYSDAASMVSFSGLNEPCSIGSIVEVVINAQGDKITNGDVIVYAESPSGKHIQCNVTYQSNSFTATFTPSEVGEWKIGILYDNEHIKGSPFNCQVYDANLVQVYGLDVGLVGQELKFTVDASKAGVGDISVTILRHGRQIHCEIEEEKIGPRRLPTGKFRISFTPNGAGQYKIHIAFNNMEVKGSPFILDIADANSVSVYGDNLRMAAVDRLSTFMVHAVGAESKDLSVVITGPSNKRKHGRVIQIDEATFRIEWKPIEAGEHLIDVRLYDQSVYESPFICNVGDPELVTIKKLPQYIDTRNLNKDHTFEIDATAAGSGNLEIVINGGRVACRVRELSPRHFVAQFTPTQRIPHIIEMKFNNEHVRGSPWNLATRESSSYATRGSDQIEANQLSELIGVGLHRAAVGEPAIFEISAIPSTPNGQRPEPLRASNVAVKVYDPNGGSIDTRIREQPNGVRCEYIVSKVGDHRLEVFINDRLIDSGPLYVAGYDSSKITIKPVGGSVVGQPVQFMVDAVEAGKGQLEISVNQGRVPNNVQMKGAGRCLVTFIPQHSGVYVIDVTFNGHQIHGCPIRVEVNSKQVGKPVSTSATAAASTERGTTTGGGGRRSTSLSQHGIAGTSPPPPPLPPANLSSPPPDRTTFSPHSHHRISSPTYIDTSYSASVSRSPIQITSSSRFIESPRSPPLVRPQHSPATSPHPRLTDAEGLKSPRLLRQTSPQPPQTQTSPRVGYTIAHYGETTNRPESRESQQPQHQEHSHTPKKYFGGGSDSGTQNQDVGLFKTTYEQRSPGTQQRNEKAVDDSGMDSFSPKSYSTPKHKYFERDEQQQPDSITTRQSADNRYVRSPDSGSGYIREREELTTTRSTSAGSGGVKSPITAIDYTHESRSGSGGNDNKPSRFEPINTTRYSQDFTDRYGSSSENIRSPPPPPPQIRSPSPPRHQYQQEEKHEKPQHLFHRRRSPSPPPPTNKNFGTMSSNIYDEIPASQTPPLQQQHQKSYTPTVSRVESLPRSRELERQPLEETERRTADFMRVKDEDDRILDQYGYGKQSYQSEPQQLQTHPQQRHYSGSEQEQAIIEPYPSDLDSLTPETRKKLESMGEKQQQQLFIRGGDLRKDHRHSGHHVEEEAIVTHEIERVETPESKPSSKPTTPKLSLRFGKGDKTKDQNGGGGGQKIFDFGKSKFSSKHEVVRRGKDVEVKLESLKLGKEDQLRIVVTPPTKRPPPGGEDVEHHQQQQQQQVTEIPHKIKKSGKTYEISFKPTEVGTHKILAFVNDEPHPQSPFPIRVYDSSQIIIGEIVRESMINDTVEFTVDAGRAGFGNLEMAIKDSDGVIIPSHVSQLESGSAKFLVTFNPTSLGTHTVNVTFNKEVIKGSPFEVKIVENLSSNQLGGAGASEVSTLESSKKKSTKKDKKETKKEKDKNGMKKGSTKAPVVERIPSLSRVGKHATLLLSAPIGSTIEATVIDASRNELPVQILNDDEGDEEIKQIRFIPEIVGDHEITIKVNGMEVSGSPFICRVHDPARIKVGEIPHGILNKPVHFVVDAAEAGVGNLEVAVNEGTIASMARALGHHKYEISFVPLEDIDHKISIRFNNEPVPGSPFLCRIGSSSSQTQFNVFGTGLERVPVGKPAEFIIQTGDDKAQMPAIEVTDPRGDKLPVTIEKDAHGKGEFTVEYTPKVVGNHTIDIRYQGQSIGTPFTSKAFDAAQARLALEEEAEVGKPCTFLIDAAKAGAGNMEIIVSVDGRNVPNFVQAESQAKFKVSFTPQEAKEHLISVKFNGSPIPGSPLRCMVIPPTSAAAGGASSRERRGMSPTLHTTTTTTTTASSERPKSNEEIRLIGDLAVAQIGKPKGFSIDSPRRNAECNVIVTGPNKKKVPVEIVKVDEGFDVEFLPENLGEYKINIEMDGKLLSICPIICQSIEEPVGSFVVNLPEIVNSGEKITFDVNVGKCDKKDEIRVEICGEDGSVIPTNVKLDRNGGIAKVTCHLSKSGSYFVDIYRNNLPLGERVHFSAAGDAAAVASQSSSALTVEDVSGVKIVYFEKKAFADRSTMFELEIAKGLENRMHLEVLDPEGNAIPVTLSRLEGQTFAAEWIPTTEGPHTVSVKINRQPVAGTPLTVSVLDLSAVRVIGLKNDAVGVQQRFNIDWSNSGGSNISVSIQHEEGELAKCSLKKIRQGLHVCTFTPKKVGLYLLNIYVDDVQLPECPYECVISNAGAVRARGDALTKAQRGKTARFEVSLGNATRGELDVLITDSLQGPLPVRCYKQQDDSYWVEFTPEQIGTHQIEVTFGEVPVAGSPFKCEVVDPKKVIIKNADDPFIIRHIAKIAVNRRAAGNGPLEIDITDPQGVPLKVEQIRNSVGDDQATFLPVKLGVHKLSVKIAGFQIPGTPKQIIVEEQGKPTVYGAALDYAVEKDMQASMIFDPKKTSGGIKVDVRNPEGEKIRHSTNKRPDGTSEISFRPNQVGLYKVSLDYNNRPIGGSPYQVNVIDPKKVLVNDEEFGKDGLLQLKVGQQNRIDVDTTAAGPGKLRVEVRDSEGEMMPDIATTENLGYGKHQIVITPKHSGNLKIYLYWAEQVVPSSYPILAIAKGEGGGGGNNVVGGRQQQQIHGYQEAQTSSRQQLREIDNDAVGHVMVRGEGLRKATLKTPAEFIIDGSEIPNAKISSTLIGDKADIPVRLQHLGNNVYKATYTPLQGGDYELHVLVDGHHIKDSPFSVNVLSHSSPSELVEVDQKSLKLGIINEEVKTIIDTRRAGSGYLTAQCVGPSKLVYCELYDHRDGTYLLSFKPNELGKHTLIIKYSEQHVPGSPFTFNVSNPPDPTKVKVYGPGVDHGILHSFKSNFIVETKGAGAGQLTVRVRGPKGAFNVEMQRDKTQDRTIHCKYEPREPGDYQVEVKWHGQHVPGSPFFVMIVDTEEELKRFLAGEAPAQMPATPFVPPGWVGPPPMGPPPPGAMMSPMGYGPPPPHSGGNRRFYGPPPPHPHPGAYGPPPPQALQPRRRPH